MKKVDAGDLLIYLLVVGAIISVATGHPQSAEMFGAGAFILGFTKYL